MVVQIAMAPLTRRGLLLLVALAAMSVIGCSRSGSISGSLYGVTLGGEAKRGVDVEIVLVYRTEGLSRKLRDLEAALNQELGPAKAAHAEAEQRASTASTRDYDHRDLSLAAAAARGASARSSSAAHEAAMQVATIRVQYKTKARELLYEAKAALTRTDVNGGFEFRDGTTGQYLILAEWAVARIQYSQVLGSYPVTDRIDWLIPVDVAAGENKAQLSSSNSGWVFSVDR